MKIKIYLFFKVSKKTTFLQLFEGAKDEIFAEMKLNKNMKYWSIADAFKKDELQYEKDIQQETAGVYFILDDEKKATQLIKDIDWIDKVRNFAHGLFPDDSVAIMHIMEYYRAQREKRTKAMDNCLKRIREKRSGFVPMNIPWE